MNGKVLVSSASLDRLIQTMNKQRANRNERTA
jgi:hypothetical protein